jgi:hypothetical protein
MPFEDVLVVVEHGRNCAARIDVAARPARDFDGHPTSLLREITVPVFVSR